MRLWHLPIAIVIVVFIISAFTIISNEDDGTIPVGLMADMKANYNSNINLTPFSSLSDDLVNKTNVNMMDVQENTESTDTSSVDAEQGAFSSLIGAGRSFLSSFGTAKTFINSASAEIGFPHLVGWFLTALLLYGTAIGILRFWK